MKMSFEEYASFDGLGLADLVRRREILPSELLEVARDATEKVNDRLSFLVAETRGYADRQLQDGLPDGPFTGVPFLRKDVPGAMKGIPSDMGCQMCEGLTSDAVDNMTARLLQTGLVIFGRTAAPSFSASITTEPAYRGPTRNPWNLNHSPAGSSGGAAAAVAAGVVPIAWAGDAGGSTRLPAHATHTFGYKPSRNLAPVGPYIDEATYGYAVFGVLTRSVRDSVAALDAVAGRDVGCRYYTPKPELPFSTLVDQQPKKLRVAVNRKSMLGDPVNQDCLRAVDEAAALLCDLGHHVEEVDAPSPGEEFVDASLTLWCAYIASAVERFGKQVGRAATPESIEPSIYAMCERGRRHSALDVLGSLEEINRLARAFGKHFENWDLILEPVSQRLAPPIGDIPGTREGISAEDYFASSLKYMGFSIRINAIGVPAASVPWSIGESGLPCSVQFVAPIGEDARCLQIARQIEIERPWASRRPPIHICEPSG